jgi:hypothetical protein
MSKLPLPGASEAHSPRRAAAGRRSWEEPQRQEDTENHAARNGVVRVSETPSVNSTGAVYATEEGIQQGVHLVEHPQRNGCRQKTETSCGHRPVCRAKSKVRTLQAQVVWGSLALAACAPQSPYAGAAYRPAPPTFHQWLAQKQQVVNATWSQADKEAFARCRLRAEAAYDQGAALRPNGLYAADMGAEQVMATCLQAESAARRAQP